MVTLHFTVLVNKLANTGLYKVSTWNRGRFRGRFMVSTSYYPL